MNEPIPLPRPSRLTLYNTLTRKKEVFEPLHPPVVGMYVCGPTVYGDGHLGHARPAITFDVLFRYLKYLGYKVRYVRNITDVGHLENDADEGEDKIAKKARLEQLEPMEIAQYFTDRYHAVMDALGVLRPSIEPRASGHIPEQIAMIEKIIANGFAYESNGSVYLDVLRYAQHYGYGQLSGRTLDQALAGYRELEGQHEKRSPVDFALWKKAAPEHIMRWQSPWSEGFPGWHIECSAMSTKYLGSFFDIHGGGLDLMFPHHEAEIAQSNACLHPQPPTNEARFWMHCNMVTINGQKMGKSLGNFITLSQFFTGDHPLLDQAYSPMTVRFFILQAHYRSTLDFSNEALIAAEKGLKRLLHGIETLRQCKPSGRSSFPIAAIEEKLHDSLNDDLNTATAIGYLFEAVSLIHAVDQGTEFLTEADLAKLNQLLHAITFEVLGLKPQTEKATAAIADQLNGVMQILIDLRQEARKNKNFALSDQIRDRLQALGIIVRDLPEGTRWMRSS